MRTTRKMMTVRALIGTISGVVLEDREVASMGSGKLEDRRVAPAD